VQLTHALNDLHTKKQTLGLRYDRWLRSLCTCQHLVQTRPPATPATSLSLTAATTHRLASLLVTAVAKRGILLRQLVQASAHLLQITL
jgi:hypothetical protein